MKKNLSLLLLNLRKPFNFMLAFPETIEANNVATSLASCKCCLKNQPSSCRKINCKEICRDTEVKVPS